MTEPESIEAFAARVYAAQDAGGGRLPLAPDGLVDWPGFPFDAVRQARALDPLAESEQPRMGEDPASCWCQDPAEAAPGWPVVWRDEHWQLKVAPPSGSPLIVILEPREHLDLVDLPADRAAEYGLLSVRLTAAVEALPSVGRCHSSRWGDGGAHAHAWFIARPARMPQLRGTFMAVWDDILPPMPVAERDANARFVVERLIAAYGGERVDG